MKAEQIEIGKVYIIRHGGTLCKVCVDRMDKLTGHKGRMHTQYICTKLSTGREITIHSAAKFRREAATCGTIGAGTP